MDDSVYVTIPRRQFEDLLKAERQLGALYAAGVDDWEGWDYACELMEEENA